MILTLAFCFAMGFLRSQQQNFPDVLQRYRSTPSMWKGSFFTWAPMTDGGVTVNMSELAEVSEFYISYHTLEDLTEMTFVSDEKGSRYGHLCGRALGEIKVTVSPEPRLE